MPEQVALPLSELPANTKKAVAFGDTKILIVRTGDTDGHPTLFALEAECPHAKGPLEQGAVCNGKLVCPWHTGTFALDSGKLLEPPPLRDLKRYAVRVMDAQVMVDPEPIAAAKPKPTGEGKHLVFAGAGAATAAALAFLRDAGFAGELTVIDPEPDEPVDRTQLSKMALAGKKPLNALPLFAGAGLQPVKLKRINDRVTKLDEPNHSLQLGSGQTLAYDALLLATGGVPERLPVDGADLPHVFTIRHSEDLRRMEPLLTPSARVAIVGDSFIAFEAASALRQRGLHVSVIARAKLPFAEKFGAQVAEALMSLHRSHGVTLHTGAEASAITPVAVTLSTGADVPADLVIVAIGVAPVVDYAPALPKGKRGGFAVDATLRATPRVWVAGDIASVDGTRIEHWRLAQQHGRVAGAAMLAEVAGASSQPLNGVPFFWTFHFGKRLNYAGHASQWDRIEIDGDVGGLDFLAYYLQEDRVSAVLECGRDSALAALMEPMREGPRELDELRHRS